MADKIFLGIFFISLVCSINSSIQSTDIYSTDFSTLSPIKHVPHEQAFLKWLNDSGFINGSKFHFPNQNVTLDWKNPKEKELIKSKIPKLKRRWLALYCKHRPTIKICGRKKGKIRYIMAEEMRKVNNRTFDPNHSLKYIDEATSWWEGPNVCIVKEHQYKNQKLFLSKYIDSEKHKKGKPNAHMSETEFLRQRKIIESSNNTKTTECNETPDKYVCETSLKVYGLSRHWNLIHQCCNNYKRDNHSNDCVAEKKLPLMDTLRKIGLTDFKKIIMREKIHSAANENITVFAPSNDMFRGLVGYKLSDSGYFDPKQISNMQFHKERDMLEKLRTETHIPAKKTVTRISGEPNEEEENQNEYEQSEMIIDRNEGEQQQNEIQDEYETSQMRVVEKDALPENDYEEEEIADIPIDESKGPRLFENIRQKRSLRIVNGDFDNYVDEDIEEEENHHQYRRKKRSSSGFVFMMKDVILNQIVPGRIDLTRIRNDDTFSSFLEGSMVRINIFGTVERPRYTANCVPLHKYITNMEATNGIIHIVNRLVPPVMNTIWDIIMQSENHSIFKKLIRNKNLMGLLSRKKPYTLLIPTDAAYKFIEEKSKHHLIEGSECGKAIIKNHIIPNVVLCASMIRSLNITTLEKNKLTFTNYYDKGIVINEEINVIKSDIMATDGVIHVIDKFLIPDSGLLLSQILKKYKFTHFQNILQSFADLSNFWDNMRRKTLFIPIDRALNSRTQSYFEKSFDDETYFNYLKYHISPYYYTSKDFVNNMLLDTQAEDTIGRINLYSTVEQFNQTEIEVTRITWNCMEIITKDIQCCGVMVHAINRVAIPPSGTIYDTLQANNEFSILFEILNGTEIADMLQDEELSATFLAPPNYILQRLSPKDMDTLLHDQIQANELLAHHLLKEVLCCAGIGNRQLGFTNEIQTYAGKPKVYSRDDMNHIHIGEAVVTVCDIMASNGVIHQISSFAIGTKKTGTISKSDIFPFITP